MDQDRNISTEHQQPGDAGRPSDSLDRDQDGDLLAKERAMEEARNNAGANPPSEEGSEPNMGDAD